MKARRSTLGLSRRCRCGCSLAGVTVVGLADGGGAVGRPYCRVLGCPSSVEEGLGGSRETVTFRDANGWSWEFDLTFMLTHYQCIWGRGCPDTKLQHSARGCGAEGIDIYQGEGDTPGRSDLTQIRGRAQCP